MISFKFLGAFASATHPPAVDPENLVDAFPFRRAGAAAPNPFVSSANRATARAPAPPPAFFPLVPPLEDPPSIFIGFMLSHVLHAGHCPSHCLASSPHSAHTYAVFVDVPDFELAYARVDRRPSLVGVITVDARARTRPNA